MIQCKSNPNAALMGNMRMKQNMSECGSVRWNMLHQNSVRVDSDPQNLDLSTEFYQKDVPGLLADNSK